MDPNLTGLLAFFGGVFGLGLVLGLAFMASRDRGHSHCRVHMDSGYAATEELARTRAIAEDAAAQALRATDMAAHSHQLYINLDQRVTRTESDVRRLGRRFSRFVGSASDAVDLVWVGAGAVAGLIIGWLIHHFIDPAAFQVAELAGKEYRLSEVWNDGLFTFTWIGVFTLLGAAIGAFASSRSTQNTNGAGN